MKRLVSMALYDPDGELAPHVRRTIEQLAQPDTVFVATATHPLKAEPAAWLRGRGELIERENTGLDMAGHRLVLERHPPADFDEILITNDTYVLIEPLAAIARRIDPTADFWGMTSSLERGRHVQSYFLAFRGAIPGSHVFTTHWRAEPAADRKSTIVANEVGLSRSLLHAGFRYDVAFRPNLRERAQAQLRSWRHPLVAPWAVVGAWSPYQVLPDAALNGRLPVVKISTLRYDPYRIGAKGLLDALESRYPDDMAGVRNYLERTHAAYRRN